MKHSSTEPEPSDADLNLRLRLLRRTIRRTHIAYRLAVWITLLMLSPIGFEVMVQRVPHSWLQAIGMNSPYAWLGMILFCLAIPSVIAAVRYSTLQSERANVLTPELVRITQTRGEDLTVPELREAALTLRAASESRWCERSVRLDAASAAGQLERLMETRLGYPIPAQPVTLETEHLPLPI